MWSNCSLGAQDENLSEYERQRLENIAQMSLQFSDVFENVSKSALDLALSTSSSAATNSSSGNKRTRNAQQYRQVKIFSKGQGKPQSHPTRRSKRLISEKRKKPEYNEQSDNDDENPSKVLRLKFPFFKNNEYTQRDKDYYKELNDADFIDSDDELTEYDDGSFRSKRKYKVSTNTHQIPVSLITQEMLKNITYSSCGKKYDAVNGTTCHQCRQKTLDQKSYCRYKKCRGIRGMFCGFCLGKRYGEDVAEVLLNKKWACPACRGYCNCSICRRKRGRSPTGQLSHIAQAGGFKSVKHMLESTEGGAPEKDLSSDYDSDENDNKGDQEDGISESIINLNDNEIQSNDVSTKVEPKAEKLNDEVIITKQEDNSVKTEVKNMLDDMNCSKNDKKIFSPIKSETTEGGIPESNLGINYSSDEDDEKDEEEDGIYENINNNNSNDDEIQYNDVISKKKSKTESINEEDTETEQNDSLAITDNTHVTKDVNSRSENRYSGMSAEMVLDKIYQELYCF